MPSIPESIIVSFEQHLITEEKSAATVEKYIRDVRAFAVWAADAEVSKTTVLAYKATITETYAPASVNSMLSSLNCFFEFWDRHDCKVKTLKIQRNIFRSQERELSKSEYNRLLAAAKDKNNERLSLVMQTICASGIRVSELRHITVEAVRNRQARISCKGKMRVVFLPEALCRMLGAYCRRHGRTSGSVFVTKSGKPLDRSNIWSDMKKLCESACVEPSKVFPHNLRHLFARTFYSLHKDIVRLADLLGHSSINTTRIYTMETGEEHRRQIELLGLIGEVTTV